MSAAVKRTSPRNGFMRSYRRRRGAIVTRSLRLVWLARRIRKVERSISRRSVRGLSSESLLGLDFLFHGLGELGREGRDFLVEAGHHLLSQRDAAREHGGHLDQQRFAARRFIEDDNRPQLVD